MIEKYHVELVHSQGDRRFTPQDDVMRWTRGAQYACLGHKVEVVVDTGNNLVLDKQARRDVVISPERSVSTDQDREPGQDALLVDVRKEAQMVANRYGQEDSRQSDAQTYRFSTTMKVNLNLNGSFSSFAARSQASAPMVRYGHCRYLVEDAHV